MAQINFYAGFEFTIYDMAGSGLGFYGPGGFGQSVQVGQYQDNTYITDATGAINGPKVNNVKFVHANSGMIPTNDTRVLRNIPNYLSSLNVRFTHTTPVRVQNVKFYIFNRTDINVPAVGVTCKVAELVHPWNTSQPTGPLGSGDTAWSTLGGSGGVISGRTYDLPLTLVDSPGTSGWSPSGANTADTRHDHYLALSGSPDTIGSKTLFGAFVTLEYL